MAYELPSDEEPLRRSTDVTGLISGKTGTIPGVKPTLDMPLCTPEGQYREYLRS